MTLASASSITGYEVSIVYTESNTLTLIALDDDATEVHRITEQRCTKRKPSQQMKDMAQKFVDWNWKRVCRIVFERQKYRCAQCGEMKPLQGHHRKHRSQGRKDTVENCEGRCQACHDHKHN